ncbi:hypothetical protein AAC387_Pa09g1636 [Persea americana]
MCGGACASSDWVFSTWHKVRWGFIYLDRARGDQSASLFWFKEIGAKRVDERAGNEEEGDLNLRRYERFVTESVTRWKSVG